MSKSLPGVAEPPHGLDGHQANSSLAEERRAGRTPPSRSNVTRATETTHTHTLSLTHTRHVTAAVTILSTYWLGLGPYS
ncbi:hypothetical protein KGM_214866 [Danaus plexippus plexippus]|uniref:Uncharacterized protein n=1 Tax=Danaus plexippus plexippus TaxID=278856 RepID=A0A212EKW5_DANPL|nr:hypothetical protein KGM_214866 [Danaus plexippus plexippus]